MARNTAKKGSASSNGPAPDASPESLDQVRDILFGGQMRMVDSRLQGLESRIQQEQAALRTEFSRAVGDLDDAMKKGLAQLGDKLASERAKRVEDLKALASDMKEALKHLERRHQGLEEAASQADAELRDHLVTQGNALSADLAKTADRLTSQIESIAARLQAEKLDTAALASGLTDLAQRLSGNGSSGKRSKG